MASTPLDRTVQLQQLMQRVGLSSFKALSSASGVSEKQIRLLRRGSAVLRVDALIRLSRALQMPLTDFLAVVLDDAALNEAVLADTPQLSSHSASAQEFAALKQEYDRLQTRLEQQKQELWQEFQQSSLQVLESLLLQLPTAAYAAQQNPQVPAVKLLPLLRPIDALLQQWEIESIALVGAEVPFDPQRHQLIEGQAAPGETVRVRYVGYQQHEKLLYRAKVSRV